MHGFAGALIAAAAATSLILAAAAVGWRLGARLAPGPDDVLTRALVTLLIAVVDVVGVMLVLGALHLLQLVAVLVVQVTIGALAWWRAPTSPGWARRVGSSRRAWWWWWPALAPCVVGAALALVLSLRGPSREFDTAHYHLVNAVQWMHDGSTLQTPFSLPGENQGDVPGDGELVAAWLMLPTGGDELAYIGNVAFGALCVLGVAVLGAELGAGTRRALLAGLAVAASPLVFSTQVHSLMTDFAAGSGCVSGVALGLRAARQPGRLRWPVLAGLGLGLGAGSKYVDLPAAVGGLALLILVLPRGERSRGGLAALAAMVAVSGFWYVRNAVTTHNPVSPIGLQIGGHDILPSPPGPERALDTPLAAHFLHLNWPIIRLTGHVAIDLLGPMALVALAGIGASLTIRRRRRLGLVAGLAVVCAVAYTLIPLTGGGPLGQLQFLIGANFRYVLPAALLAVAAGVAAWPLASTVVVGAGLVYDGVRILQGPDFRPDLSVTPGVLAWTALLVGVVALLTLLRRAPVLPSWSLRGGAVVAAGAGTVALAASSLLAPVRQPPGPSTVQRALAEANRGRSVAVIDVIDVRSVLAPSFDIVPVAVGDGPAGAEAPITDPGAFTARLRELGTAVVVVGPAPYPLEERPRAWSPPAWLRHVGVQDGADVYVSE